MGDVLYVRNVKSLNHLAGELKRIIDDYWNGKIPEATLKEYVRYVAGNTRLLENNGEDINITIRLAIGKRRTAIVLKMLENYQLRLF